MEFSFDFNVEKQWPPLAWIAECTVGASVIHVWHGNQVEVRDKWFCEAIWDGDFEAGDFDRTDLVFGSGGRLRGNYFNFVSSGSTVDRLQYVKQGNKLFISNSLTCLLTVTGIKVELTYERYQTFFRSIERGIDAYEKVLPTIDENVKLIYYRNLQWNGKQLIEVDKPFQPRNFNSFKGYHKFLRTSMASIAENMRSGNRNHQYEMICSLSSGYDSTTTAVLAREAGMKKAFSFYTARGGFVDHGKKTAEILGLDLTMLDRRGWQIKPFVEVPYISSTGEGADIIFYAAENLLQGQVLLTGFNGDKVWGLEEIMDSEPDLIRRDISGLSFTEHRLICGCIHWPVPFMGIRQIRDIHTISNSEEMRPWSIHNYSRPICRRIVEEAGVPRELFGRNKKMATTLFHTGEAQLTDETLTDYHKWLKENALIWETLGLKKPLVPGLLILTLRRHYYFISRLMHALGKFMPSYIREWLVTKDTTLQRSLSLHINTMTHIFPWAIERLSERYLLKNDCIP